MKKLLFSALLMGTLTTGVYAQNAREASVRFNKTNENAVVADYDKSGEIVEAALRKQLEKDGLVKAKNSKGFLTFQGVNWKTVSADKLDVYFKIENKKGKSTVTAFLSKGYDNFLHSGSDPKAIEQLKEFLNGLDQHAQIHQHSLNVKAQEEAVAKAEKAYNASNTAAKDLQHEKEKLEKKIADNANEAAARLKALEEEKQKLMSLHQPAE
jgi:hypothetical protein